MWFLFWTWVLNVMCAKGYKTVAWMLVAIPLLVFFTLMFGLANVVVSGSASAPASAGASGAAPSTASHTVETTARNGKASKQLNTNTTPRLGESVYGNKAVKVGFYPNETNTTYSSYASYDANLDNRAEFLDRESKGQVQPQQQHQP